MAQGSRVIHRRRFLVSAAGAISSCSRIHPKTGTLGTLAYVDVENLWLRDLPEGLPRRIATGHRIAWPKFSPSGRWIAFQDGSLARVVSAITGSDGGRWNTGQVGESPVAWVGGRDELAVCLATPNTDEPSDRLPVFSPSDGWRAPRWSMPLGMNADIGFAFAVTRSMARIAYASTIAIGENIDGSGRFRTSLLLHPLSSGSQAVRLTECPGSFDLAGFTPSGKWLLYWKQDEISADLGEDGLGLYAASIEDRKTFDPGIQTLVYSDMIAISPTKELAAVTLGFGRETWSNKSIALLDLSHGEPELRVLTEPSLAAQLPSWSPDGDQLAWCAGPVPGERKAIPLGSNLRLGAEWETIQRSLRMRRIYSAELSKLGRPRQLTNDPRYSDEEPVWSASGSHILFCRINANNARTIWLMRSDGSEMRQMAGPLRPPPDLSDEEKLSYKVFYGYTDWRSLFDSIFQSTNEPERRV